MVKTKHFEEKLIRSFCFLLFCLDFEKKKKKKNFEAKLIRKKRFDVDNHDVTKSH